MIFGPDLSDSFSKTCYQVKLNDLNVQRTFLHEFVNGVNGKFDFEYINTLMLRPPVLSMAEITEGRPGF